MTDNLQTLTINLAPVSHLFQVALQKAHQENGIGTDVSESVFLLFKQNVKDLSKVREFMPLVTLK